MRAIDPGWAWTPDPAREQDVYAAADAVQQAQEDCACIRLDRDGRCVRCRLPHDLRACPTCGRVGWVAPTALRCNACAATTWRAA